MCEAKSKTLTVAPDESRKAPDKDRYPILSRVSRPADVRGMSGSELIGLCGDIRRFLIESLSSNPGHFASSMGAVELTVALHYVFNTPYDRIVWDVGHQAYGHKLITGRADRFHTNRKLGGLSGFPNPDESEYDTFTAGHASNSISAALGMSVASALNNDSPRRNVVAVIGDASISGGLAFEGLNNAANTNSNLLIILNDNDMSIDHNVGSLNSYLAHLTASKGYNSFRYGVYRLLKKLHLFNDNSKGRILRFNNSLKSLLTKEQNIFEGLNIRYFGPFDGHDLPRIIKVLDDIKDMSGPRLLHLRTTKGKGYEPAENDPAVWHAPGCFEPESGERKSESKDPARTKFQDAMGSTLVELARDNKAIVGITAAMTSGTSMNMMQQEMPQRTFDVGISEGHAVTFAGGLATDGMLPYVAIYSAFLQRAYDNIINDVAVQGLPVTFCIDRAGLVGEDGVTHHGANDLAYMRTVPGMTIASPRDADQLRSLLYTSQLPDRCGPWAIRYPRGCGHDSHKPMQRMTVGRGECLSRGEDVTMLTIGPIAFEAAQGAKLAAAGGVSVAHYDMVFLKPLDDEIMEEVAASGRPIVTVEDGTIDGGLGSAVLEWLAAKGHNLPVVRMGIPDAFVPQGTVEQLRRLCRYDAASIAETIMKLKK